MKKLSAILAGLLLATPIFADPFGELELTIGGMSYSNTDDIESGKLGAVGIAASVSQEFGDWTFGIDLNHIQRNLGGGALFEDFAPEKATALGLHFGQTFDHSYWGGFIGKNKFQGFNSGTPNGYVTGWLYGVEFTQDLKFGRLFGQAGKADMLGHTLGSTNDSAFDGNFARIGLDFSLSRGDLLVSYELGRSDDIFEDIGDSGTYERIEVVYEHAITDRLIGVLGADLIYVDANIEDASAETTWTIGLRMPFGGAKQRNPLRTTYMPGLAAAWAETLDNPSFLP